jgi:uncharacterized membrane protein YfcA
MPGIEWIVLYILLGSFVGFIAGLLGAGGGGILVPLLVSIFAYQGIGGDNVVHMALGTALACMILSSSSSSYAHAARGAVVWKLVGGMAPGIILGAVLTTAIAADIDSVYIAIFFAVFMAFVSVQMFMNWKPKPGLKSTNLHGLFLTGLGIGSVASLAAVGGGFLSIAYMTYKNVEMKKAIATSAAIGLFIAIAGTLGYMISGWSKTENDSYTLGFIYVPAFVAISITSMLAAPSGTRWAHRLPESWLKKIFAGISLALSIKMLVSVIDM